MLNLLYRFASRLPRSFSAWAHLAFWTTSAYSLSSTILVEERAGERRLDKSGAMRMLQYGTARKETPSVHS